MDDQFLPEDRPEQDQDEKKERRFPLWLILLPILLLLPLGVGGVYLHTTNRLRDKVTALPPPETRHVTNHIRLITYEALRATERGAIDASASRPLDEPTDESAGQASEGADEGLIYEDPDDPACLTMPPPCEDPDDPACSVIFICDDPNDPACFPLPTEMPIPVCDDPTDPACSPVPTEEPIEIPTEELPEVPPEEPPPPPPEEPPPPPDW